MQRKMQERKCKGRFLQRPNTHVVCRKGTVRILNGETPIPPGALGRLNATAEGSTNEVPSKWVCQGVCKELAPNLPQEAKRVPKGSQK